MPIAIGAARPPFTAHSLPRFTLATPIGMGPNVTAPPGGESQRRCCTPDSSKLVSSGGVLRVDTATPDGRARRSEGRTACSSHAGNKTAPAAQAP